MSNVFYVLLGITLIVAFNFGVTLAVVLFYFFVAKIEENFVYRLKLAGWLSLSNILAQFLALVAFSSGGVVVYALVTLVLSLLGYLIVLKLGYKFHALENAILAGTLSIILSPYWLHLFGLIL